MTKSSRSNKKQASIAKPSKTKNRSKDENLPGKSTLDKWGPLILLAIGCIIVFQTRLRLLAIPMERDEAGFAYIGHWLLHGKNLYTDMVDNKLPGLYVLYGLFTSIFGYNSTGVHIGLLISNIASGICFYYLLKNLYNRFIAAVATAFLVMLLVNQNVLGFAAHATQLLLPFALGGFLFFWKGIRTGNKLLFFVAGLLLGFAFIIKQQSVVFGLLAAGLWWPLRLVWNKSESGRLPIVEWLSLGLGGCLPIAAIIGYFSINGRLGDLYFWSVKQPAGMSGTFINTSGELIQHFVPMVTNHVVALWLLAGMGLVVVFLSGFQKSVAWFGSLLGILGLGSVIIGAAFYQHYFILALPGVALLAAITFYWISIKINKVGLAISLAGAAILLLRPIGIDHEYFFSPDYNKIHQQAYNKNMFPELEKIGKELSRRVPEGSRIGILGSEPEVLVAADRESCTKHLFMYPLLSDPVLSPPLQEGFVHQLEECRPDYIVWNSGAGSWTTGYDKLDMFKQIYEWIQQNYVPVGLAEFRPYKPGEIAWDKDLRTFQSLNDEKIFVFKIK